MELKSLFNHKTFLRRMASLLMVGAAAVAFQGVAYAHHEVVAASASCSNGSAFITYTITSWDPGNPNGDGDNAAINVLFNGVVVDTEPFLSSTTPPDQFTNTLPAPADTPEVDVTAASAGVWGDGQVGDTVPANVVPVTIPTNCSPGIGRFTGGGKQITINLVDGTTVAVTKGFEVDCDLHTPSNSLEINWAGGQNFHMTAFTSAVCTLTGSPNPPKAPVNTIVGTGTGKFNNSAGYTVVFELIDNGEPGTSDAASFVVCLTDPASPNTCAIPANVVLSTPLTTITTGNVQAHVDQK